MTVTCCCFFLNYHLSHHLSEYPIFLNTTNCYCEKNTENKQGIIIKDPAKQLRTLTYNAVTNAVNTGQLTC